MRERRKVRLSLVMVALLVAVCTGLCVLLYRQAGMGEGKKGQASVASIEKSSPALMRDQTAKEAIAYIEQVKGEHRAIRGFLPPAQHGGKTREASAPAQQAMESHDAWVASTRGDWAGVKGLMSSGAAAK